MGITEDAFQRMLEGGGAHGPRSEEKEQAEPRPTLECSADDCVFYRKNIGPAHCSHAAPDFKISKSHKRRHFAIAGCMSYMQNPNMINLEGGEMITKGDRVMAELESHFDIEN